MDFTPDRRHFLGVAAGAAALTPFGLADPAAGVIGAARLISDHVFKAAEPSGRASPDGRATS